MKEYDICVFGATGFTGRFVAAEVALQAKERNLRIAFAGRDASRLKDVVKQAQEAADYGGDIVALVADVRQPSTLGAMARASKVLINCVGPFRFYGEPVVQACIAESCDYVDITGEPEFMERMEVKFDQAAKAANVLIVSCCGFDSIPADCGAAFAADTLRQAGAVPTFVESFLTLHSGPSGMAGHYATYESAVHGFGSAMELRRIRQQYNADHPNAIVPVYGKITKRPDAFFWAKEVATWAVPFMGSDASVVRRTQRTLVHREQVTPSATAQVPFAYNAFACIQSNWGLALLLLYGFIFSLLARFAWGRAILLQYPKLFSNGIFSHEGPSHQQMSETSFSMRFIAKGYSSAHANEVLAVPQVGKQRRITDLPAPDVECAVEVAGPEPGYVATSRIVTAAALSLLEDRSLIKYDGGVLTPGAAFNGTRLVDRLIARGIDFTVREAAHPAGSRTRTAPSRKNE